MKILKLVAIGIVTVMVLLVLSTPITADWYDTKTGDCRIYNENPTVDNFIYNFEIERGKKAGCYHWVQETRQYHQRYYAFGYYTHYTKTKSYGWRGQVKREVPQNYQIYPAFRFGGAGHQYDELPTATYVHPYDNGAAMNYDGDTMDFEKEARKEAKVKITGTGSTKYISSYVAINDGISCIELHSPNLLDDVIEYPESGATYEIPVTNYEDVVVTISTDGGEALIITEDLGEEVWITAS